MGLGAKGIDVERAATLEGLTRVRMALAEQYATSGQLSADNWPLVAYCSASAMRTRVKPSSVAARSTSIPLAPRPTDSTFF